METPIKLQEETPLVDNKSDEKETKIDSKKMNTPKFMSSNTYKIKNNDVSIAVTLSNLNNNTLVIKIIENDSIPSRSYTENFTLEKLKKINRYFKLFETIEELLPELNNLFEENKITFALNSDSIELEISFPLKVIEKGILIIPETEKDSKQVISDLCTVVNELRKKVKKLENQLPNSKISEEKLKENLSSNQIILNEEEEKMIFNWILSKVEPEKKTIKKTLLYKLTKDGDSASTFHSKCNYQGNTLSLIRNTKGYRFGGFTTESMSSSESYLNDKSAFVFSLDYKECYFSFDGVNAIYDYPSYGPTFGSGHDFYIANQCSQNYSNYCNFPYSYGGGDIRPRILSGGYYYFKVQEVEVFKIEYVD